MTDYYSNGRPDWDNQFRETPWERQERQRKARQRARDRDGAEGGDAKAAPVPQDRQARAEGIAQIPPSFQRTTP